ncbi:MAG: hypothetical protein K9J27_03585 [Bacteroidales bacterium]|nr:hypothetical protein [Bacteroidales bacterium]MCF8333672.1 hypothetical protein [Bacteroidales bacterium]
MENTILTEYPMWFLLLCIAGGLLYASILYVRNKKYNYSLGLKWGLAILRFIAVTVIAFLLLSPLFRYTSYETEKPVIVFAQDNSASVKLSESAGDFGRQYVKDVKRLKDRLSEKYAVETYTFGERVEQTDSITFDETTTNFAPLVENINVNYANRNVGAIVLASDGIYNQGINPLYSDLSSSFNVYSLGLGDPQPRREARIVKVIANDIAFIGNKFPVEVLINASMAKGERTVLKVFRDDEKIFTREIRINQNSFSEKISFYLEAEEKGLQEYRLELDSLEREKNVVNNERKFFVDVLDDKSSILVLSHSPHPDVNAIKTALEQSKRNEVEVSLLEAFDGRIAKYDMVVLHQIPAENKKSAQMLDRIFEQKIPSLFVIGQQSSIRFFNSLNTGLQINNTNESLNEVLPEFNHDFTLFNTNVRLKNLFEEAPPLKSPFGDYESSPSMNPYLYQKLDDLSTKMPLIALSSQQEQKTGVIAGTGIWKWRVRDYLMHENHETFNEFVNAIARYMILNRDRDLFRVDYENRYAENEEVILTAELYNSSYELVNEPEVKLMLENQQGETFEYVFDRTSDKYRLNAGALETGTYNFTASTKRGGENYRKEGRFVVTPVNLEARNTQANHEMLKQLSEKYNGAFFTQNQMEPLADTLLNNEKIKPVRYSRLDYRPLIDVEWILVIILLLLSTEWFLRKYHGGY